MFKRFHKFLARLVKPEDRIHLQGKVSLFIDGKEELLGENLVLPGYRNHIAGMMVDPNYAAPTAWPTAIAVGTSSSPVSANNIYPLDGQLTTRDGSETVDLHLPIESRTVDTAEQSVTFTATLPANQEVYSDTGSSVVLTTDFTINEWGLVSVSGEHAELLARKVRTFDKEATTTVEVQWKIYL